MAKESLIKQSLPLSLILASRFFGLFIVMPILSLYALSLQGSSPILIGIAMGGYALTQVLFQIPFGFLSDKFGRKSMIALGLVVFVFGSLVCALSADIYWLIVGRLMQGAGAVGGVISAMIADLVREENRTKAMALMGGIIFSALIRETISNFGRIGHSNKQNYKSKKCQNTGNPKKAWDSIMRTKNRT